MISAKERLDENSPDNAIRGSAEERLSRSQQTRAAAAVNRLGLELTLLSSSELDRLDLPERLREVIDVCQKLKARSRGRQNRLIGQLLRGEDHEAIRVLVESMKKSRHDGVQQEKATERWRDRLVEEGDPAVEALIRECPQADRQRLRLLVRNARQDPKNKKAKRARLELLRAIRTLRSSE